jgi:hypothetical protein
MWFAYFDNFANWHVVKIEQVKEIIAQNKQGNKVSSLEDFAIEIVSEPEKDFNNAMGQESLTRFDQPRKSKNKNRNKNKAKAQNQNTEQNKGHNQNPPEKRPIIIKKNEDKK